MNEYVKRSHRFNRVFVVHRLDRETSGLMMYAKDEKTQNTVRDNWHDIVTDRRYVSIVCLLYTSSSRSAAGKIVFTHSCHSSFSSLHRWETVSYTHLIYRYYNSDLTHKNRPVRESAEGNWLTRQAASTLCGFPSSIC